ncbi:MAG: type I-E CRISPR-associated protein Cas7/Cse4/CasC [Gemmatimonadaceae bacterium]|jgi:CRISPR system Cascade subunit CasC|nr:type I-E CRISPR-associated protein Cas7/Cse4/CasC [Gemmatimonadaceae bacterium]
MSESRFLQLHFLTSFAGVLLNRDDAGLAKRLSYGGAVRTRVSSQCLKRHWRVSDGPWSLAGTGAPLSVRTRDLFGYAIHPRLAALLPAAPTDVIEAAGAALSRGLYGEKADDPKKRQALLLGWREVEYLTQRLSEVIRSAETAKEAQQGVERLFKDKDSRKVLSTIRDAGGDLAAGLEAALFGRMVTSDPAANTDAALHVAHAFTVHEQESETDYFTVVDDLKMRDEDADGGSAGIFDTELTSGLYYGYVVVDVPLLVANLTGTPPETWNASDTDRDLAARVIEHLVHLVATVSPGAKKGSTAPYAYADTVLIEAGSRQPRSLAAAFERPVRRPRDGSISEEAERALFKRLSAVDGAYGTDGSKRFLSLASADVPGIGTSIPLDELASWAADRVRTATC